jgi:hypothetical protein
MQPEKSVGTRSTQIIITFLVLISCTLVASADQTKDSDKYTFTNYGGEVYTPEPMEFGANLNGNESVTLKNGTERKHVYLQFYSIPNDSQRSFLKNYSVVFVKYSGAYSYVFSMPADYTAADLPDNVGLRWMGEIPVENKYDKSYGLNVPNYAKMEDGNVKLAIHFYEDVKSQDSENIVKKYSDNFSTPLNGKPWFYRAIINEANITFVASEDAVNKIAYYGSEVVSDYNNDFVDYEMITEEDVDGPMPVAEQETVENINDSEEKESPGFTATIAIMVFALISILVKRK